LAAAGVAAALGAGVVACGSGHSGPQAWTLVAAAPAKTTDAGSAQFALTAATNVLGQSVSFTGSGAFDFTHHAGHVRFALPAALGGASVDEIVTATTIYLQIPSVTPAGKYAAVKLTDVAGTDNPLSQLGNADPTAALETLRGASHDVRKVGTATIRGTSTTHYRGTIDVTAAIQAAPPSLRDKVQQTFGQVKSLPFDAYIDDQGRLRRFEQHLTLPATSATGGQTVTVESTFDLYDFGTTVHVSAPPANRTVDGSALLQQLLRRS
jgi:hypothetical protein